MPMRTVAAAGLALVACQHADELIDVGSPTMPLATAEPQRINVDEIGPKVVRHTGVGRVVPSLADPRFEAPRAYVTAFDDPPPPEPIELTDAQRWYAGIDGSTRRLVREICVAGRGDPCFGWMPLPRGAAASSASVLLSRLRETVPEWTQALDYCRQRNGLPVCDTPLVVAFAGESIAVDDGDATFAFQPGVPVHTVWPTAATPWIALDRDGDGAITSGAELFGDATVLPDGTRARHGFEALAALDANHDGVIDRRDPMFERLVLWSDRDRDRRSSPDELRPLADTIVEIPLAYATAPRCEAAYCEGERAAVTWRDRAGRVQTGAVIDLYLQRR